MNEPIHARPSIVYIASPYRGDVKRNHHYALRALRDSVERGEVPVASHLLYPQILDDAVPSDRELGRKLGHLLLERCDLLAIYVDHGVSAGMVSEIEAASRAGIQFEFRYLKKEDSDD